MSMHVDVGLLHINTAGTEVFIPWKIKLQHLLIVARMSSCARVAGHFGTSDKISGPKDRSVWAYGLNCLTTRIEM